MLGLIIQTGNYSANFCSYEAAHFDGNSLVYTFFSFAIYSAILQNWHRKCQYIYRVMTLHPPPQFYNLGVMANYIYCIFTKYMYSTVPYCTVQKNIKEED